MTTDNNKRFFVLGALLLLLAGIIVLRLGYIQLVRHDYFQVLAQQSHFRKFEIAPQRGQIMMRDRGNVIPVAMNRKLKTLYADTRYLYEPEEAITALKEVLGNDYSQEINQADGYVELEDELTLEVAEEIEKREISGLGFSDSYDRVYPEGSLAASALGFVNDEGEGQYGIEGYLDDQLNGTPGMFDSQTDANGVPIATSDNIQTEPVDGSDVVLTIDRNVQSKVETALKNGVEETGAESAHAVVMDPGNGEVIAIGNYPGFDPNEFNQVENFDRFLNTAATSLFEPGSGFKVFTMAAGLESGAIEPEDTFLDRGSVQVADALIENAEGGSGITRTMTDIITYSVNTGVVHILKQLGGGEINEQAKTTLHDYFTKRFHLDKATGIEQAGEPEFNMATPDEVGPVNYANMTFGQGVATTMVRMTASMSAVVNGGTLYKPTLVDYQVRPDGVAEENRPQTVKEGVVSKSTSTEVRKMMATVVEDGGGYAINQALPDHAIGGKTGTAQVPHPEGGYYTDRDIGTFTGFAPVDGPRFVVMVRVDYPKTPGFAGSAAAGPVFAEIMEWLVKYDGIPPEGN